MTARLKLCDERCPGAVCGPSVHLTLYLCDECAEELGDEVICIETLRAGEDHFCEHCEFNRDTEMDEEFWPEPY